MAAKRLFDEGGEGEGEGEDHHDQGHHKRPKTRFASVIREVVMVNFLENFCSALEPMLRRVVSEEVENGLRRRCPTTTVAVPVPSSRMIENVPVRLQLSFPKPLSLPIFTGTKIVDADGNSLKILLADGHARTLKLEMVVLDGEFPKDGASTWTREEFSRNIVKERTGKRPLLTGDLSLSMRDGIASVGDIQFTDNSSWIRCRKFRIGARVVCCGDREVVIQEAITQAFVVKDHRGELYKKHHPPGLKDAVWRLEKIGKGGSFHQKLKSHGIHTVQDLLKLYHVHPHNLRKIMGSGMSDKMWETTLKHAKECVVPPNLVYKFHGPADDYILTLNPVCQLLTFQYNGGHLFHYNDLATIQSRAYIERLVKDAYAKWNTLEIVHLQHPTPTPPLIQGAEVVEQLQRQPEEGEGEGAEEEMVVRTCSSSSYVMMDSGEGDYSAPTNDHYNL